MMGGIFDAVGNVLTGILRTVVGALLQGMTEALKWVSTYFLYLPAPELQGSGGASPAERVQGYTDWAVVIVGMIGMAFALVVVARRRNAESATDLFLGFLRVILVTGAGIPAISLLAKFGDSAAPWLVNQISGGTLEDGLGTMSGLDAAALSGMSVGVLVLLVVALLLGVLGGILNLFMVMFNWGVLPVAAGLLPVFAAAAMTERGQDSFRRVVGWILAILLFKPVAAVIYGVGIASSRMISGGVDDAGQVIMQGLYGTVLLMAAGLALPAIARLVVPAMTAGTRGGGAGLIAGAAMVAAGAVTGGAAAVAAVGARGASLAGSAAAVGTGATGAALSGAASAAGGSGAASGGAAAGGGGAAAGGSGAMSGGGASAAPTGAPGAAESGAVTAAPEAAAAGSAPAASGAAEPAAAAAPAAAGADAVPVSRAASLGRRIAATGAYQVSGQVGSLEQSVEAGER